MKRLQKIVGIMIAIALQVSILGNSIYAAEDSTLSEVPSDNQIEVIKLEEASTGGTGEDESSTISEQPSVESDEELTEVTEAETPINTETPVSQPEVEEDSIQDDVLPTTEDEDDEKSSEEIKEVTAEEIVEEEKIVKKDIKKANKDKKTKKDKNAYLKTLSSKELTKEANSLTEEELYSYLKEVKGYSDLQINGEIPIINKNGNLFFYSNKKLQSYMATPKDKEKYRKIQQNASKNLDKSRVRRSSSMLTNDIQEDKVLMQPDASDEITILRDEYSKFYKLEDGTNQSVISAIPVHYLDENKFKDISVNINEDSNGTYEYANRENSFKTFFNSSDSLDDNIIAKYIKNNELGVERQLEFKILGANPTGETLRENKIKYHNIFPNVDVEYQINPVRLKENIYVNQPVSEINYEFLLNLDGVIPRVKDTLDIEFVDIETEEIIWVMERPYAEDSGINQLVTRDMHYAIDTINIDGEEMVRFKLVMDDPNFLTDATYPIIIDPTIFPSTSNMRMVIEGSDEGYGFENEHFLYGFPGTDCEYRVYMNFGLSSMPSNSVVERAELQIYPVSGIGNDIGSYYRCRRVTSDFSYATWDNRPSTTTQNQARRYTSSSGETKFFLIKDLLNDAIGSGNFYGVEISGEDRTTGFYTDMSRLPKLILTYRVNQVPFIRYCNIQDYYKLVGDREAWAIQIAITDDAPSDELSTDFYVNGVKKNTKTGTAPIFLIPVAQLNDGLATIKFISTDGVYTAEKTVHVYIDKNSPVVSNVQLTPYETSVNMIVQASDAPYNMPSTPYSYGVNGTFGSYISNSSYNFTGLAPSTEYTLGLKVKDTVEQVTEKTYEVTTKAMMPTVSISDIRSNAMNIDITDTNGVETDYLIQVGNQYASASGTLVDVAEWIRFTGAKTVDLTGLASGQAYVIKVKARNGELVETAYSSSVTATTIGEVPAVVQGLRAVIEDDSVTMHWDALVDATNYDIEINDQVVQISTQSYTIPDPQMDNNYRIRVRGVNQNGNGDWSEYMEFVPSSIITVNSVTGNNYYATWRVNDYTSFANKKFALIYDATAFEATDLCAYTYTQELAVGMIAGTNVEITSIADGRIEFIMHKTLVASQTYTGPINTIKLKSLQTGESVITFEVIDVQ